MGDNENASNSDFIRSKINDDLKTNKYNGRVHTRFPPEPNGYLHIGHAKSICLNFGIAQEFTGLCNLRFDDTNPEKEDMEYVDSIIEDVEWLGFDWQERMYYASDYFDQLYDWAVQLIKTENAYICELTSDEFKDYRGTLTEPGKNSPFRNRPAAENLEIFTDMKAGKIEENQYVLRAKIDMGHPNLHMRDPVIYRIINTSHHRTGSKWHIYPMYDYAHPLSDSIENITHSLCTLEFEIHRPLYDWFINALELESRPEQTEFSRLNLTYTIMSKRKLLELVTEKLVNGWDDPRMPTICGLRRRGYTPASLRNFCSKIGITKFNSLTDIALLEHCVRDDLNKTANRVMVVLDPLKIIIENYPENKTEDLDAINNPEDESMGKRKVPFSREIYIERNDFLENAPKKFFRLSPGKEVRLRYAYYITCTNVVKNEESGEIIELTCTYDPETRGGSSPDKRKVKGTLHWVSAEHALNAEVRLYDRLFTVEEPDAVKGDHGYEKFLNPESLKILTNCKAEPSLSTAAAGSSFQFERQGYFNVDPDSSDSNHLIFNRTVALRDSWTKKNK